MTQRANRATISAAQLGGIADAAKAKLDAALAKLDETPETRSTVSHADPRRLYSMADDDLITRAETRNNGEENR